MLGAPGYRRQATTTWRFVLAGLLSLSNSAAEVASWNLQEHLRKQRAKQKETAAIQDGEAGKFGVSFLRAVVEQQRRKLHKTEGSVYFCRSSLNSVVDGCACSPLET